MANSVIGALRVNLGIDTAQFETGLKKAQGGLAGFGKAAGAGLAGVAAAAAAVGVALAAGVRGAIDSADEMSKAAAKYGVGIETLSGLKHAADLSGVSLEGLGTGLQKLSRNMLDVASGGGKEAARAFEALGISVTNTDGSLKSSDGVLKELAARFADMPDGAQKTALAMQVLGKSGADLIPLLNGGADGLNAMMQEAEDLGLVISQQTATAAETFNDNLARLGKVGTGITTQLAAGLAPALANVTDVLVNVAKNTNVVEQVSRVLAGTLKSLVSGVIILGAAWKAQITVIATVAAAFMKVARGDFAGAWAEIAKGARAGTADFRGAVSAVQKVWSDTGADVSASAPKVSSQIAAPIVQAGGKIKKAVDEIRSDLRLVDPESLKLDIDTFGENTWDPSKTDYSAIKVPVIPELDMGDVEAVNDNLRGAAEEMSRAFDDAFVGVASGFDQLFYGLKNKNWVGAASGLIGAIESVKAAFAKGGTTGGKIGAVAGAADAVGQMVGGVAGSALSGAAGGAMAGFTVAGPIGAAVGGIIGGIAGLFSGSSAKKKAKAEEARRLAEEARQRAEEEAARLAAIATEKRLLEIQIMEMSGDAAGALAAVRADELAAMDESNRALAQQVYDLQDKAKLDGLNNQRRALEIALMSAQGKAVEALAAQRQMELAAMDPALRALQNRIWATEDLAAAEQVVAAAAQALTDARIAALDEEAAALETNRSTFEAFFQQFTDYAAGLGAVSKTVAADFDRIAKAARLGDTAAMEGLIGAADAFRASLAKTAGSTLDIARGEARIRAGVLGAADTAKRQVSIFDQQLSAIQASREALAGIDATALSIEALTAEYNEAQAALAEVQLANDALSLEALNTINDTLQVGLAAVASQVAEQARTTRKWDEIGMPAVQAA